ncbi:MAG: hypothetical protein OCC46_02805 [Pseudodesulfovibrio sp.]
MEKKPILTFQVEPEEKEAIKDYLDEHGIKKRSPFIRESVFAYMNSDKPQMRREMLDEFKEMRRAFANAGNNLNQVAAHLNMKRPVSTEQVLESHRDLQRSFGEMVRFYRRIEDVLRG